MLGGRAFHEVLMNQMTAKARITKQGEAAIAALNLHEKDVIEGKMFHELTPEQRKKALRVVALIKEKRDGRLKGRVCADGRPQRAYTDPAAVYSPTVSTKNMTLTLAVDAAEKRFVSVCDIDGAYLHAHMDEFVIMVFKGHMAEMQEIPPRHERREEDPVRPSKTRPIRMHSFCDALVEDAFGVSN